MPNQTSTTLVCQHGMHRPTCSLCQPRRSPHDLISTLGDRVEAARPRLLRLARLNGIGPDDAEDVVQETYLEAWRSLAKLQPEHLSAWLDGICRNVCKRHRHAHATTPLVSALSEQLDEATIELPDPLAIDPAADLERQDLQVLLDRALGHLSKHTRELIELCYLAELPQRDVAERLDMSLGALELKLHRARRQLSQVLHGELRDDAQAFGLLLSEEESLGWHETRQWCVLCGNQRLRGIVEQQPGGTATLRLRCPACSPRYQIDYTHTALAPGRGPIRSFRPAMKRVMDAGAAFYHACLNQQRCPTCHSTVQIRIIDRSTLVAPYGLYDALPLGVYARVTCPSCGPSCCEAYIPLLLHAPIRDFLLRPRVRYEPATFTTYDGSDAIRFRLLDLATSESLTVLAHPQTLHLLAAIQP